MPQSGECCMSQPWQGSMLEHFLNPTMSAPHPAEPAQKMEKYKRLPDQATGPGPSSPKAWRNLGRYVRDQRRTQDMLSLIDAPRVALTAIAGVICIASPYANADPDRMQSNANRRCAHDSHEGRQMATPNISEKATIETVIFAYFEALNHGDVNVATGLYADDPVQLPFMQPTVVGTEAVRNGYQDLFRLVRFQVHTKIEETVKMSPEWAFVRTESAGMLTPVKTGQASPATFHEVFILRRTIDGKWRIARYSFSPTAPLPEF